MRTDIVIKGMDALKKKMDELANKTQNKAGRKGLRAGAKKIAKVAKQLVPVDTGELKQAIKVRAGKKRRNRITMFVGGADGWFKGKTFYAGFVEWGHAVGDTGKVPAKSFIAEAFDKEAEAAGKEAIATIWETIVAEIGKGK